ncbi:hypothetical protein FAGKG844_160093 [Frankia sp. AgKG'84/4]
MDGMDTARRRSRLGRGPRTEGSMTLHCASGCTGVVSPPGPHGTPTRAITLPDAQQTSQYQTYVR